MNMHPYVCVKRVQYGCRFRILSRCLVHIAGMTGINEIFDLNGTARILWHKMIYRQVRANFGFRDAAIPTSKGV